MKRPRTYTPEIAQQLCYRLMCGDTLNTICRDKHFPSKPTVMAWLANPDLQGFKDMYYDARRIQAEARIDDIFDIAEDVGDDWVPVYERVAVEKGVQPSERTLRGFKPKHTTIHRAKLLIETTKWYANKMLPKLYGDHIDIEHGITGDLQKLLESATNKDNGLPPPIEEKQLTNATHEIVQEETPFVAPRTKMRERLARGG